MTIFEYIDWQESLGGKPLPFGSNQPESVGESREADAPRLSPTYATVAMCDQPLFIHASE